MFGQLSRHAQQTVRATTDVEVLVVAQKDIPQEVKEKLAGEIGKTRVSDGLHDGDSVGSDRSIRRRRPVNFFQAKISVAFF